MQLISGNERERVIVTVTAHYNKATLRPLS